MNKILGIDTSCYTTSLALVADGQLVAEKRKILQVEPGERGLQQSAALFQHVHNLPILIKELFREYSPAEIKGITASTRPRPATGSYMPVFTAGMGFGESLAVALQVPFFSTSHQEGHIMAGLWSAGGPEENEFLAVHMSGGTTELLKVQKSMDGYNIKLLGGSKDLHAGQFVDRIGVALGIDFPAGPALELLAQGSNSVIRIPSSVKDFEISFSGPETAAQRLINEKMPPQDIARAVEHCIATSIEKMVRRGIEEFKIKPVLIVGGVAANMYIRDRLSERLEHRAVGARLYFAEPRFSTDNALGVALLGYNFLLKKA